VATDAGGRAGDEGDEGDDLTDGSGWETASDDDEADASAAAPNGTRSAGPAGDGAAAAAQSGQPRVGASGVAPAGEGEAAGEWDVCRSLFDGHVAPSMAANLEYMWKRFGFYFPGAEHLADPEGLLKYLVRIVALCVFSGGCVGSLMQTSVDIASPFVLLREYYILKCEHPVGLERLLKYCCPLGAVGKSVKIFFISFWQRALTQ